MTQKTWWSRNLILTALLVTVSVAGLAQSGNKQPPSAANPAQGADVSGTWSGTFFSKHSNVTPFTFTVVVTRDSRGHFVGNSSLSSNCLKGAQLQVTINGSNVVFAGSSEEGDNITVRGKVDESGTLMKATYILNGSATGKCETDDGTADLAKR